MTAYPAYPVPIQFRVLSRLDPRVLKATDVASPDIAGYVLGLVGQDRLAQAPTGRWPVVHVPGTAADHS